MPRRTIKNPNITIPGPQSRAERTRTWEQANPTTSYRLPQELRDQVTELANELSVTTSEIARALLEHSLAEYRAGHLTLHPRLSTGKLTLFPDK